MKTCTEILRKSGLFLALVITMIGTNGYGQTKLAAVEVNGKWGFIESNGNWKIMPQFEGLDPFSE